VTFGSAAAERLLSSSGWHETRHSFGDQALTGAPTGRLAVSREAVAQLFPIAIARVRGDTSVEAIVSERRGFRALQVPSA
jgi:hypothetical protein